MLNRRSLFGALPAIGAIAVPAAAHATQLIPVQSEAEAFCAALSLIHPAIGPQARKALADGWKPEEMFSIVNASNGRPAVMFTRTVSEEPADKPGFEGWTKRTTQLATYQHEREPDLSTDVSAFDPRTSSRPIWSAH